MSEIILLPQDKYNAQLLHNVHPAEWQNPTPNGRYNLVVIGAGTAGLVTAAAAAGLGAKVALVEKHLMGGDCLNVGCVPSKTIIRSAKLLGDLDMAAHLGVNVPQGVEIDFGAVMARMRQIRAKISPDDSVWRYRDLGVDVFLGSGKFSSPTSLEVNGVTLNFKKAVIATGARAQTLPIPGLAEAGYYTNESIFTLTERPNRLAVIGAGPIGAELAQSFRRLGCEVTLLQRSPQILSREDREAANIIEKVLVREGVQLALGVKFKQVTLAGQAKIIAYEHEGQAKQITVDAILVAAGRVPNVEGLNLEVVGVVYNSKGVEVNDYLQTTNPRIFAAGDICMKQQFTHAADAAARIVIQNALFMGRKKLSALTIPWCTYTDPEVAHVGIYPAEAEAAGIEVDTFTRHFSEVHRAITDSEEEGFVKVQVKKGTDKIVGATIVARHAGDMINEITLAMVANVGLKTLATVIHPYPTQAEAIKQIADAYNRTRLTPTAKQLLSGWLSWTK